MKKFLSVGLKDRIKRSMYFFSNRVYCNTCNTYQEGFYPIGTDNQAITRNQIIGAGRRNVVCKHCSSTDRERLILLFLTKERGFPNKMEGTKILHIAPEKGLVWSIEKLKNVDYILGDKFAKKLEHRCLQEIDICAIAFPENHFDGIICNHVLEHIIDDQLAMRELCRVLKPGGWGILQVPISAVLDKTFEDFSLTSEKEREAAFGQFDHVRIYGADYIERLSNAGFCVQKIYLFNKGYQNRYKRMALNPHEYIYFVSK